jgi:hypothetical protein
MSLFVSVFPVDMILGLLFFFFVHRAPCCFQLLLNPIGGGGGVNSGCFIPPVIEPELSFDLDLGCCSRIGCCRRRQIKSVI